MEGSRAARGAGDGSPPPGRRRQFALIPSILRRNLATPWCPLSADVINASLIFLRQLLQPVLRFGLGHAWQPTEVQSRQSVVHYGHRGND